MRVCVRVSMYLCVFVCLYVFVCICMCVGVFGSKKPTFHPGCPLQCIYPRGRERKSSSDC